VSVAENANTELLMRRATLILLVLLAACVAGNPPAAPRAEVPFQLFVSIYGDSLKLSDDSTYLVKSPGSNVWLAGRWDSAPNSTGPVHGGQFVAAGEFCGELGAAANASSWRCGGFWDLKIAKRLQDPRSVFFNDQVSRFWDLR
jgi:hypothetical protein